MKKLILFTLLLVIAGIQIQAQKLTREEFIEKKRAYITEQAGLTEAESIKFFPLYFELRGKIRSLENTSHEDALKKAKPSEQEYSAVLEKRYDNRIESARLEKEYYYKFRSFLTNEKIYKINKAEIDFHRTILKKMVR